MNNAINISKETIKERRDAGEELFVLSAYPPDDDYVVHHTFLSAEEAVEHCNETGLSHDDISVDGSSYDIALFWKLFVN